VNPHLKRFAMIEVIPESTPDLVAVTARGTVTAEDYERVLIPAIENKLRRGHKLRFLYHLGDDFREYTPAAMWDDAKLGVQHRNDFEKVAVVTDASWARNAAEFFAFLVPCPVKVFANEQLSAAKSWLAE